MANTELLDPRVHSHFCGGKVDGAARCSFRKANWGMEGAQVWNRILHGAVVCSDALKPLRSELAKLASLVRLWTRFQEHVDEH